MTPPNIIYWLCALITVLAFIATGIGLFWKSPGKSYSVQTVHGQSAQLYGRGLYRHDTLFFGAGFKGQDTTLLFLGIPLLIVSSILSSRGLLTGHLLLTGVLGYFLYVYASMALGAAYNQLFLVYIALMSSSLFAFILMCLSVDNTALSSAITDNVPKQGIAIFMLVSGLVTLVVWGMPLINALRNNAVPDHLDIYTTPVTYALDLAIITPGTFICAALIFQDIASGYLIAMPLLILIVLLTPQIILSTVFQKRAGVAFTTGEMIGPVAGFAVLGFVALLLTLALLQGVQ